jgi:ABC-type multidrug transport system fused ATPase/permease subunit
MSERSTASEFDREVAADLRTRGDGDPGAGLARTVGTFTTALVARQRVIDEVTADIRSKREKARIAHERTLAEVRQSRTDRLDRARAEADARDSAAVAQRDEALLEFETQRRTKVEELRTTHEAELLRLQRALEESVLMAEAMREAGEEADRVRSRELAERLRRAMLEASELDQRARAYLRSCRLPVPASSGSPSPETDAPAEKELASLLERAAEHLETLLATRAARLLSGPSPFLLSGALVIGAGVIGGASTLFDEARWLKFAGLSAGGALVLVIVLLLVLRSVAMGAMKRVWEPFSADLAAIERAKQRAEREDAAAREAGQARLRETEAREEREAHAKYDAPIAEVPKAHRRRRDRAEASAAAATAESTARCDAALAASREELARSLARIEAEAEEAERAEFARAEAQRNALVEEEEARLRGARDQWIRTATDCRDALTAVEREDRALSTPWSSFDFERGGIARSRAPLFRFGSFELAPRGLPGGLPSDPAFAVEMPEKFVLPAALAFPRTGNLVIETTPENRDAAVAAVKSLVARILTTIPPSKVRFTFVDPVGLGENFAAFMHLGDEFEQLVGERIWTDPRAIEQRLADIAEHMETVIQKYLRNEFEDIDAYNDAAGEIAEPYRFLVVADFPANFSDQAAARLHSILRAGQRCGVHVVILRDAKAPIPDGLAADEIAATSIVVRSDPKDRTRFSIAGGMHATELAALPLRLDTAPADASLIPMLSRIGRHAKTAARVEVPFDAIAPKPDVFWSLSSARNLRVPVGRAGATRLQQFLLGEGTSQHALIAGKTGSGKSTLLHAIITGLATWYSPDEVELWLVDFKKGVEFKTYAENELPHARAVAIESDREFGLSVLEGLDTELSRRGELFREAGVQDIASFRGVRPDARMPRILLVIDEFQEFFLDDDRVSQGASMLLDRLVRQGRAFGMHALLGSQTLGGAYSLARSTMGQMGVRIALQCTEADSQLILSDDNLAARLLSRPGEAIYNDAGGRVEGNSPFQVAFLPDEKRDIWLGEAQRRAKGRFDALPRIVFEGDARAAMSLHPGVRGAAKPDPRGNVRIWTGEAVAIKDPTCARLARAAGANVAAISPRDDQAVATAAAFLLSIKAEAPDAVIDLLDGTPADAPEHGVLERFARDRGVAVNVVGYRDVEAKLAEIAEDVTSRADNPGRPRRFLVIHQLQRYRALRRNEDDFSFGASEGPPSPDKLLGGIVREGPIAGVHVLVVSDTLSNLQRSFDRNALREFDWKVLYQISPADSSTLIDSPAASRLGTNRGLLHSEELGLLEKFRPYAL